MKKLLIITTGGTIAMKWDPFTDAILSAKSGKELLDSVPQIKQIARLELIEFSNIDSTEMTPLMMFELAQLVRKHIVRPDIQGIIITHGTDTLEETAYMLDLLVDSSKPVVCTAAMRSFNELGTDGPRNLLAATRVAGSRTCCKLGTLVVLNDEIHAGREVRKTYTSNVATFESLGYGPLGIVDEDRVLIFRKSLNRETIAAQHIEEQVLLIKMTAGDDGCLVDYALKHRVKGLVIEGLGRGNIPSRTAAKVIEALQLKIPVVLTSRCFKGRVLGVYGGEGGGKHLREAGIIFGGDLSGTKARIKLMVALGNTRDIAEIRQLFEQQYY
ncbi:asparaginase [candidate division KSB1 bacterium]|nr:asparaginase [candidate division KSB1 bacterium]